MKQATVPVGAPGIVGTHTYAYDALGRRVSKTVGSLTTVFVNDGLQEIAEYENGTLARSYVFGSYIDEPLLLVAAGVKTYYHANNLYSVAALTNQAGAVVERMTYDPYGKVTILAANGVTVLAASSVGNPWTFTGRRLDGETGLMYSRARMYDPGLGRFIGRDPIGCRGDLRMVVIQAMNFLYGNGRSAVEQLLSSPLRPGSNAYEYVGGHVTDSLDPLGLEKFCCRQWKKGYEIDFGPGAANLRKCIDTRLGQMFPTPQGVIAGTCQGVVTIGCSAGVSGASLGLNSLAALTLLNEARKLCMTQHCVNCVATTKTTKTGSVPGSSYYQPYCLYTYTVESCPTGDMIDSCTVTRDP